MPCLKISYDLGDTAWNSKLLQISLLSISMMLGNLAITWSASS